MLHEQHRLFSAPVFIMFTVWLDFIEEILARHSQLVELIHDNDGVALCMRRSIYVLFLAFVKMSYINCALLAPQAFSLPRLAWMRQWWVLEGRLGNPCILTLPHWGEETSRILHIIQAHATPSTSVNGRKLQHYAANQLSTWDTAAPLLEEAYTSSHLFAGVSEAPTQ